MEQPYFLFNSNIYNYYTGINNIYSKAPNEKMYDSKNFSSQFPHQEKIIRTVKNKKIVYCQGDFSSYPQNYIFNEMRTSNNKIENKEKEMNLNRGQRGSKYRGVSKNGNQWQVLIMINKKKRYIELLALMILLLFKIMVLKLKLIFIILQRKLIE